MTEEKTGTHDSPCQQPAAMHSYIVRYQAEYTLVVNAENEDEAHRIAEETDLEKWGRYGSEYDVRDLSQLPQDIPKHVRKSLTRLIDYLWEDQLKRVRVLYERDPESYFEEDVFVHLAELRAWLDPRNFQPAWYTDNA